MLNIHFNNTLSACAISDSPDIMNLQDINKKISVNIQYFIKCNRCEKTIYNADDLCLWRVDNQYYCKECFYKVQEYKDIREIQECCLANSDYLTVTENFNIISGKWKKPISFNGKYWLLKFNGLYNPQYLRKEVRRNIRVYLLSNEHQAELRQDVNINLLFTFSEPRFIGVQLFTLQENRLKHYHCTNVADYTDVDCLGNFSHNKFFKKNILEIEMPEIEDFISALCKMLTMINADSTYQIHPSGMPTINDLIDNAKVVQEDTEGAKVFSSSMHGDDGIPDNFLTCVSCDASIDPENDEFREYDGEVYCQSCFDNDFGYCDGCDEYCNSDNIRYAESSNRYYCESCYEDKFIHKCESCNSTIDTNEDSDDDWTTDSNGTYYCMDCYNDEYGYECEQCSRNYNTDTDGEPEEYKDMKFCSSECVDNWKDEHEFICDECYAEFDDVNDELVEYKDKGFCSERCRDKWIELNESNEKSEENGGENVNT